MGKMPYEELRTLRDHLRSGEFAKFAVNEWQDLLRRRRIASLGALEEEREFAGGGRGRWGRVAHGAVSKRSRLNS